MILKRSSEIDIMAQAAVINRQALEAVAQAVAPGVTTADLDAIAEDSIRSQGGTPAFLGYNGFPASLCTSINSVVVHGIPSSTKLRSGDIISVDIGTFYKGYAADMAYTFAVGEVPKRTKELLTATEQSLYAGIAQMHVGRKMGDVSVAIQEVVEAAGFWVVREFVGHGIGTSFHESPEVPNYGRPGRGTKLRPGLVLAVEPMVTMNQTSVDILDDGWTAPTHDGSLAAHFEHTIAITNDGPRILTAADQAPLASPDVLRDPTPYMFAGGAYGS